MMPFITEELYQKLPNFHGKSESICIATYPEYVKEWDNKEIEKSFDTLNSISKSLRQMISNVGLMPSIRPECFAFVHNDPQTQKLISEQYGIISTLARVNSIKLLNNETDAPKGCITTTVGANIRVFASVKEYIKVEAEIARLNKKISETEGFIQKVEKKMQAKDYNTKVPEEVRKEDADKIEKYRAEIKVLNDAFETMKGFI